MIKYTVVWTQSAIESLAELWTEAENPSTVTDAANEIDNLLKVDAEKRGMQTPTRLISFTLLPLRVLFTLSEPDRLVTIHSVAALPPSTGNGQYFT